MKKRIYILLVFLLPLVAFAELNHLIITEIALQPGNGEYIQIYNPTRAEIDLTNYYLTDATDAANGKYYYNLPGGTNYHSGTGSDFTARFPQGSKIPAGASIIIAMATAINYNSQYDSNPDLSIKDDFLNAIDRILSIGGAPYYLDNASETLVLFYWDGVSSAVKDVDYLIWGDRQHAIDKSGVAGYFDDTPIDQQEFMPVHIDGEKLQRISGEGDEAQTGGNGITGHDETSEKFSQTWQIVSVGNRKPEISSITITPKNPISEDKIQFTARVTDDGQVTVVNLIWYFNGDDKHTEPMTDAGNDYYTTAEIGHFEVVDTLFYYVYAEDETGLNDSSIIYSVVLEEPEPEITIAYIRENWSDWEGQTVTLRGVVTIGSNILRTDRTSAYFQDASGKGLNLYDGA
ncbi:lamin tail domain-containing protein, partial [bacterium]|nr:lamin tail domain-containing protein [bacterium]